jgi:hypothetical protein
VRLRGLRALDPVHGWAMSPDSGRPVRSESRHDDFRSEYIGIQEIVGFFEGFVSELADVAAGFVALMRLIKAKKFSDPDYLTAHWLPYST